MAKRKEQTSNSQNPSPKGDFSDLEEAFFSTFDESSPEAIPAIGAEGAAASVPAVEGGDAAAARAPDAEAPREGDADASGAAPIEGDAPDPVVLGGPAAAPADQGEREAPDASTAPAVEAALRADAEPALPSLEALDALPAADALEGADDSEADDSEADDSEADDSEGDDAASDDLADLPALHGAEAALAAPPTEDTSELRGISASDAASLPAASPEEPGPDVTAELPLDAIRAMEAEHIAQLEAEHIAQLEAEAADEAHRPPPVPATFTTESFASSDEDDARAARFAAETADALEAQGAFPVTSVEDALEALSADESEADDLSEDYEDDDDEAPVVMAAHISPSDLPTHNTRSVMVQTGAYDAYDDTLVETTELIEEVTLEPLAAPPPLPDEQLADEADLPPVSPVFARAMDDKMAEARDRLSHLDGASPSVPWADDGASDLPSPAAAPQVDPEASFGDAGAPEDLARRLLALKSPWLLARPLPPMPAPELALDERGAFIAGAQQLSLEAAELDASPERASLLAEVARLWSIGGQEARAGEALHDAVQAQDDNPAVRRALADWALARGSIAEALAQLEALAVSEPTASAQAAALIEAALLRLHGAGGDDDLSAGIAALEEVASGEPEHPIAHPLLAAAHLKSGRLSARLRAKAGDPGGAPGSWEGILLRLGTGDGGEDALLDALRGGLASDPGDLSTLAVLWRILARGGRHGERGALAAARGEATAQGRGQLARARWLKLAAFAFDAAGDAESAIQHLTAARIADPADRVLEWRLEASLAQSEAWAALADLLSPDDRPRSDEEVAVRLARRAAIQLHRLGDDAGALVSLEAALGRFPDFDWANQARVSLLRRQGDAAPLIKALLAEADAGALPGPELAARRFEAALLLEQTGGEVAEVRRLVDAAAEAAPGSIYRWTAWRLAEAAFDAEAAGAHLEGLGPFSVEGGALQGVSLRAISVEYGGDEERALDLYKDALTMGRDPLAAIGMLRILSRRGDNAGILEALPALAGALGRGAQAFFTFEEGRLQLHHAGDEERAARAFAQLSLGDEPFIPAVRLLASLRPTTPLGEGAEVRDLWPEAEAKGDLSALSEIEVHGPGSLAFQARGLACCHRGDWDALIGLLEPLSSGWACWHRGQLELSLGRSQRGLASLSVAWVQEPDEALAVELLWGSGDALAAHFGALERLPLALSRFAHDPTAPEVGAWLERAAQVPADRQSALELMAQRYAALGETLPLARTCLSLAELPGQGGHRWLAAHLLAEAGHKAEAAEALEALADAPGMGALVAREWRVLKAGDTPAQVHALTGALADLPEDASPEARLWTLMSLGIWQEASGERAAADTFAKALTIRPDFSPARVALVRVNTRAEAWKAVAEQLKAHAEVTPSAALKQSLMERWEEIRATRLEDASAREARLRRRLPGEAPLSQSFLDLAALLEGQARWGDLAEVYRGELARLPDADAPPARADLRLELARLLDERLGDPSAAWEVYMDVLEERERDPEALKALKRIARDKGNWSGLVAVLAREASFAEPKARIPLYREIARTWHQKLEDTSAAMASWKKVLENVPEDPEALGALVELYRIEEDWPSLVDVGSRLLRKQPDNGALIRELGEILATRLGRNREARDYLERAATGGHFSFVGFKALSRALEATGTRDERRGILLLLADNAPNEEEELEAWTKLEDLGNAEGDDELVLRAQEAMVRLSPEDPEPLRRLALSFDQSGQGDRALRTLEQLAGHRSFLEALPLSERLVLHRRRAHHLEASGRKADALREYEAIARLDPSDVRAEVRSLDLLQELGLWERCAEHLESMLQRRGDLLDEKERVRRLLELGRARRRAGHLDRAVQAYQRVATLAPEEVAAYLGLISILRERGEWLQLLKLYNQVITHATDPAQVVQAYVDKADVLDEELSRTDIEYIDKAAMHFEKALQFDRRNTYCMLRLSEIAIRKGSYEGAGSWLQSLFSSGPSLAYQARAHVLSGILAAEFQKDIGTAQSHFRRAAAVAQVSEGLVASLVQVSTGSPGQRDALFGLYEQVKEGLSGKR